MNEQPPASPVPGLLNRVRALSRRTARENEGCYWIEGIRQFLHAHLSSHDFSAVIYSPVLLKSGEVEKQVRRLAAAGVRRVRVTPEEFRSISITEHASGIGAIVRQRWTPLDEADAGRGLCWLVIERIRSLGNLGSILRTAEACGASGLIVVGPHCDPFDPAIVRASMGGFFRLPLIRTTYAELAKWKQTHGVQFAGLSPEANHLWTELPPGAPLALILGEERGGLNEDQRRLCDTLIRLPMTGAADSLNVSVAAGIVMYELVRRGV